MPTASEEKQPESASSDKFFVPKFDNTTVGYKEWRKRIQLYAHRQKLQGRSRETALNVLSVLEGAAWRQCEDLELSELEREDGIQTILRRLDAQWQYDERVEMPEAFEKFFFRLVRKQGQSLLDFCSEFNQALRELKKFKIELPQEVSGWLMLRRAALSKEQQLMIQTHIGTTLTLTAVEPALYLILGQDHKHAHVPQRRNPLQQQQGRWKPRQLVHAVVDEEPEDSAAWDQLDQTYYEAEDVTEDWFDDPDDTYWQEDDEAFFYDAMSVDDSSLFDTEDFDQVYAAYTDAKQRMQQLRQSRGFYPVVAMVDQRQMPLGSSTTPRSPSPPSGKKGKGKKSKGKSTSSSSSGKGPTGKARAKDAMAGMPETRTCLRCGKVGHLAANCQTKTGSPKKRVLEDGDPLLAGMVFHQEHLQFEDAVEDLEQPVFYDAEEAYAQGEQLVRAGGWLTERADTAIQDQGASSFLMGTEYLLRYIRWLAAKGFDVSQLEFKRCDKAFRFGGDAEGHSRWMISLPVLIEGVPGRIQSYVIFGATPMLLGRPVLEKLQTIVDFGDNRMRIMGGPWKEIERGKQGAMLLPLCQNLHEADQLSQPVFDLRSEDDHAESATLHEFLKDLNAEQRYEEMKSEVEGLADDGPQAEEKEGVEKAIESLEKFFVCCEHQLQEIKKKQSQMLQEARPEARRRKLVWEVYAGRGRVSEECARSGAEVMRFGLDDGWDFTKAKHRRALLSMQQELEPDEVFISPKCTLWSPMQNINVRNEEDAQALREKQWEDHEIHLKFARRLYLQQAKHGRHAHIERPAPSKAWSTPAFKSLPGMQVTFDQCAYGATTWTDDGQWAPIKKSTTLKTTKQAMVWQMSRRRSGDHAHHPWPNTLPRPSWLMKGYTNRSMQLDKKNS